MSQFDTNKDYYGILGASESSSRQDIERLYKQRAARHHPDRGGNEEAMKSLNEAYGVLKDDAVRLLYDNQRRRAAESQFTTVTAAPARDIGLFGHGLSAFLCLLLGLFLLLLVRSQWIWFLWPLAILAVFVILFGVLMARGAMRAANASLPSTNFFRSHWLLQEIVFWTLVIAGGLGVYVVLNL